MTAAFAKNSGSTLKWNDIFAIFCLHIVSVNFVSEPLTQIPSSPVRPVDHVRKVSSKTKIYDELGLLVVSSDMSLFHLRAFSAAQAYHKANKSLMLPLIQQAAA